MKAFILTWMILTVIGVAVRLIMLGAEQYPRTFRYDAIDAVWHILVAIAGLIWASWVVLQ